MSRHASTPHLTCAHETGHRVERRGLALPGAVYFPSWSDPALSAWREAVIQSTAIKFQMKYFNRFGTDDEKNLVDYLILPQEMWARSYAQYLAEMSQDEIMLAELQGIQKAIISGDILPLQWQSADFTAIFDAIDALFKAKGWIP